MSQKRIFPLSKLTEAIENVINTHCNKVVWVKAEIVKLNHYPQTGHCYPDLVEKKDGKIVAEKRQRIGRKVAHPPPLPLNEPDKLKPLCVFVTTVGGNCARPSWPVTLAADTELAVCAVFAVTAFPATME